MWGPEAFTGEILENYVEAPNGRRTAQYFDKSRMEINHDPSVSPNSAWYVTNGLLVMELATGRLQIGDNAYQSREPARINVAGDANDTSNVTYWLFGLLMDEAPSTADSVIDKILTPGAAGRLYMLSPDMASYDVRSTYYVPETQHTIAGPFWGFMNSHGSVYKAGTVQHSPLFLDPFYATGFPITEAYWARVKVAGALTDVLIQCFERRCLTYTPSNPEGWKAEAGNVGRHYYSWRYGEGETPPPPPPSDTPAPPPEPPVSPPNQLPEIIVSEAWAYPQSAVVAAVNEIIGLPASSPYLAQFLQEENVLALTFLYNITTVDVGKWNHDTRGFHDWLKWFIGTWAASGWNASLHNHIRAQLIAGIYQPESEMALRMSWFEANLNADQPGSGPWAYWYVLMNPARWVRQYGLALPLQDGYGSEVAAEFSNLVRNYQSQLNTGQYSTFREFLAEQNYMPEWYE